MKESKLFPEIEKVYFEDNYQKVIETWNNHKKNFSFDFNNIKDRRILEALVVSYGQLDRTKESLIHINRFIRFIKTQKDRINKYSKEIDFYFLIKSSIFSKEKKFYREYYTIVEYFKLGGKNEKLKKCSDELEEFLFRSYRKFNQYFNYGFIGFMGLDIISRSINCPIIKPLPQLILVLFGLVWISLNDYSNRVSRKVFLFLLKKFSFLCPH